MSKHGKNRKKRARKNGTAPNLESLFLQTEQMIGGKFGTPKVRGRLTQGRKKLSLAILEVADPLLELDLDKKARNNFISLAILAWNLSLMPESKRAAHIRTFFAGFQITMSRAAVTEVHEFITMLMDRKRRMYPDDDRFVVNFEILEEDESYTLNVVSVKYPDADR